MKNYYEILEVSQNASPEIIEKSYKILVKRYHPDTQPKDKLYWAEIQMKEINEAYKVLSDPDIKAQYDNQMGFNSVDYYQKYNELYNENQNLKQQVNTPRDSNPKSKKSKYYENSTLQSIVTLVTNLNFRSYFKSLKNMLDAESSSEKKNRLIALFFTIVIVTILVILFWKVPFLNKLLFF